MLDHVRPDGAEDLRIVLDRSPDLMRDAGQGAIDSLHQAWAEEGRVRTNPSAYAVRFVADWRAASAVHVEARHEPNEIQAERRMDRLDERMLQQPALERALDRTVPERQLKIDDPGRTEPSRNLDFGMER